MKRKANRELVLLFILIPLFVAVVFILSKYHGGQGYDYSVSGKGLSGYSIIYEVMNDLGFDTARGNNVLKDGLPFDLNIVVPSQSFNINDDNIKSWIKSGGSLIVLSPEGKTEVSYGTDRVEVDDNISSYSFGAGRIITASSDSLTNKTLSKDTEGAYKLLNYLSNCRYKKAVFNEYYLYPIGEKISLWNDTPYGIKIMLYQCVLVLFLFIFMKGKRFGRAVNLREETERAENEYVYSAAALFKKAGCFDIMLENYRDSLLSDIKKTLRLNDEVTIDNFVDIWGREKLPSLNNAKGIQNDIKSALKSKNKRQCIRAASGIEELMDILKSRREFQWK